MREKCALCTLSKTGFARSHRFLKRILILFSGCVAFHSIRPSSTDTARRVQARSSQVRYTDAAARTVIGVLLQWERRFCSYNSFDRSSRAFSCSVLIRPVLKALSRSPSLSPSLARQAAANRDA